MVSYAHTVYSFVCIACIISLHMHTATCTYIRTLLKLHVAKHAKLSKLKVIT